MQTRLLGLQWHFPSQSWTNVWFTLVAGTAVHCSDTPLQDCSWQLSLTDSLHLCPSGPQTLVKRSTLFKVMPLSWEQPEFKDGLMWGQEGPVLFSLWGHLCRVIPAPEFPVKLTDTSGVTALQLSFSLCLSLQFLFPHRCRCQDHSLMNHLQAMFNLWIGFPGNPHCSKNFSLQQDCCFLSHVVYC